MSTNHSHNLGPLSSFDFNGDGKLSYPESQAMLGMGKMSYEKTQKHNRQGDEQPWPWNDDDKRKGTKKQKEKDERLPSFIDHDDWCSVDTYDHNAVMRAIRKKKFRDNTDDIVLDTRFRNVRFDADDIIEMSEYLNEWETLEWLIEECKPSFTQEDADELDERWGRVEVGTRIRNGKVTTWVDRYE